MAKAKYLIALIIMMMPLAVFSAEKLTLLLDWFANPDHAPIFVARQQGFFKAQGLDVTILNSADPADPPKMVAANKADLAITYQPELLLAVNQGLPLVRIATLIDTPLNCLTVLESSPIKKLEDLAGKKIGYASGGTDQLIIKAELAAKGINTDQIKFINVHYDLTQALLSHQVDAISGVMRNYELTELKLLGQPARAFYPEENGIPSYDELVIVMHRNKLTDPRMKKFIIALNQGALYLANHPEESWLKFAKEHKELNTALNHRAWFDTLPRFALTPAALDPSKYELFSQFLLKQGAIKADMPVQDYAVALQYVKSLHRTKNYVIKSASDRII